MNHREAMEAAIMGDAIRAVDMPDGTFVKYDFNGFRINHHDGASSGFTFRSHDESVDWEIVPNEHFEAYKRRLAEYDGVTTREQAERLADRLRPVIAPVGWGNPLPPIELDDDVPKPADPSPWGAWGQPSNVGSVEPPAPKRDSWGRLIKGE